jgi:glycosyltransferase involved in cell wall biosynthesis
MKLRSEVEHNPVSSVPVRRMQPRDNPRVTNRALVRGHGDRPQPSLLVIGAEPPPATGMEIAMQAMLAEFDRRGVRYRRVDTADPEDALGNRGRWTYRNVALALRNLLAVARGSLHTDVAAVYVPVAQEFPALVRDVAFIAAARLSRRPVVIHLHGGMLHEFYEAQTRPVRALLRHTLGRAALGIALTEGLRPALECLLPRERVVVVPNGIDFPVAGNRKPRGTVHVLYVSSLFRWKGPLVFIEAFARAHRTCPELRATVAGDWPSADVRTEALALVRELGVEDVVSFPGPVVGSAKAELFEDADVFCFTSLVPEGQPLVIIEAMASRLPVVAPRYPGIADTVLDEETGMLVTEVSPEAVCDRLVTLARDEDLRVRLGDAGRHRYDELFTQRAFGDRMIHVLEPYVHPEQVGVQEATAQ